MRNDAKLSRSGKNKRCRSQTRRGAGSRAATLAALPLLGSRAAIPCGERTPADGAGSAGSSRPTRFADPGSPAPSRRTARDYSNNARDYSNNAGSKWCAGSAITAVNTKPRETNESNQINGILKYRYWGLCIDNRSFTPVSFLYRYIDIFNPPLNICNALRTQMCRPVT